MARWITNIEDPARLTTALVTAKQAVDSAGTDPRALAQAGAAHQLAVTRLSGHYATMESIRASHGDVKFGDPQGTPRKSADAIKADGYIGVYLAPPEGNPNAG